MTGFRRALHKRAVPTEKVDAAVERIVQNLLALGVREVPARQIGDMVMDELYQLDQVAYIRFASVYREFADLEDLRREVEGLATPGDGRPVGRNGEDGGSSTEP